MNEIEPHTLAQARAGDRRALGRVVQAQGPTVYGVVSRMLVRHPGAVDDVAQDAFVKIIRFFGDFTGETEAALTTWVATLTTRTCLDFLRRPQRVEVLAAESAEATVTGLDEATDERRLEARVRQHMATLPNDQRAVLVLRAYHDFDYPEIAAALGVELGTVKSRLSRARQALRRTLGRTGGEDD